VNGDAVFGEGLADDRHRVGAPAGKDLGQLLENRDLEPAAGQDVRHLHADVAGADDDGLPRAGGEHALERAAVGELAEHEDPREIHAGQGKTDRHGAGGQHQGVERFAALRAGLEVAHQHPALVGVEVHCLVAEVQVDAALLDGAFRAEHHQVVHVPVRVLDVVGHAACPVGDVGAPLEHRDPGLRVAPAGLAGGAHAGGDAADDHDSRVLRHRALQCRIILPAEESCHEGERKLAGPMTNLQRPSVLVVLPSPGLEFPQYF